jgi:hypothetical protein
MSDAAELAANPTIRAGSVGLEPQHGDVAGYGVDLSRESGNPEAVNHVGAGNLNLNKAASRYMQDANGTTHICGVIVLKCPVPPLPDHPNRPPRATSWNGVD